MIGAELLDLIASDVLGDEQSASTVSMPIGPDVQTTIEEFGPTGGRGQRAFRRSLGITAAPGADVELLAMLGGSLSWVGPGFHIGEVSPRDRVAYETTESALVLAVDIKAVLARIHRLQAERMMPPARGTDEAWHPPNALDLPVPRWIIYEGATVRPPEADVQPPAPEPPVKVPLDGFPVEFPAVGQPFSDLPSAERTRVDDILRPVTEKLANPGFIAHVEGHADDTGTREFNQALSVRRAELIKQRIVDLHAALPAAGPPAAGAPAARPIAERITTGGWGEDRPWADKSLPIDQQRRLNRRVEITVGPSPTPAAPVAGETPAPSPTPLAGNLPELEVTVATGEPIGKFNGTVRITILDGDGRYLDPLALVQRFDVRRELDDHPLAIGRNPLAPAVATGRFHLLFRRESPDDAIPADRPYFNREHFDPPDVNPLQGLLDRAVQANNLFDGDVVWICDVPQLIANLTLQHQLTLLATSDSGGATVLRPADADAPILTIQPATGDPKSGEVGVRILGLTFEDGAAADGGGALRATGVRRLHVARCAFRRNRTDAGGGAIRLEQCDQVLIENGSFDDNTAAESGGAIFLDRCGAVSALDTTFTGNKTRQDGGAIFAVGSGLVVAGRPPDAFDLFRETLGDEAPLTAMSAVLGRDQYATWFDGNVANSLVDLAPGGAPGSAEEGAGGAIALRGSTFRVEHGHFRGNVAGACGGAIAAFVADASLARFRERAEAEADWAPFTMRGGIARCVFRGNSAPAGGAIAIVGEPTPKVVLAGGADAAAPPSVEASWSLDRGGGAFIGYNLVHDNGTGPELQANELPFQALLGGGIHLMTGIFLVRGNRVSNNAVLTAGGGLSCVGTCYARIEGNLILKNESAGSSLVPGEGASVVELRSRGGGGGIFARWYVLDHATRLYLSGNRVVDNDAGAGHGGGILATAGSVVRLTGGNLFRINRAARSGGAIAVRNADLRVAGDDRFESNQAGGDGGAIACVGVSIVRPNPPPSMDELYALTKRALTSAYISSFTGADLAVVRDGGAAAPHFVGNSAGGHGGAIFVGQQPVSPAAVEATVAPGSIQPQQIDGLTAEQARERARDAPKTLNLAGGFVRPIQIEDATFADNTSDGTPGGLHAGSTIALQELDHEWLEDAIELVETGLGGLMTFDRDKHFWLQRYDLLLEQRPQLTQPGRHSLQRLHSQQPRGPGVLLIRSEEAVAQPQITVLASGSDPVTPVASTNIPRLTEL